MSHTLTLTLDDDLHAWLTKSAKAMDKLTRDLSQPVPSQTITAEQFAVMCIDRIRGMQIDNMEQAKK